ncbi:MAG TPA: tripartite tricarboxylate transporter substrate binding protein [Pseudolabrys sp.]|nr:tripartite tricarboxylate transporter substrate binding protein [Pseudolabrys sp.]
MMMLTIVATGRRFFPLAQAARASKLLLLFAALAGSLLWQAPGARAEYPDRPLKIIVPFAAGGSTDVMARKIADLLSKKWGGKPVFVESRPGGGTAIGGIALANAAPDGYTILIGPDTTFAINQLLTSRPQYDPLKDFAPITGLVAFPMAIVVDAKLPVKTLKEFVAYAKTHPTNYGSFGVASAPHLTMEMFKQAAGVDIVHVPYKGVAPVLLALQAGEIQATAISPAAAAPYVKQGIMRILAVDGKERWPSAPDVPTYAEAGFPTVRAPGWWAIGAPAKTPAPIINKLNHDLREIIDAPDFKEYLVTMGYKPASGTPEQLEALMQDTAALWAPVIKRLHIDLK